MNMHKNTRLTPHHRQAIWLAYTQEKESVTSLARRYQVSRVTIYRTLKAARGRLLKPQTSTNNRFKQAKYGMKCRKSSHCLHFFYYGKQLFVLAWVILKRLSVITKNRAGFPCLSTFLTMPDSGSNGSSGQPLFFQKRFQ